MKLQLVPARTGVDWVRSGLRTFWRQPLAFMSLFFLFMALITVASQLPLIGSIVAPVLLPFMTLALMVATAAAHEGAAEPRGSRTTAAAMFVGAVQAVRRDWRPMAVLGAISAVYFVIAVAFSALIDGGQLAGAYLLDDQLTPEVMAGSDFQTARLLVMCLNLPLSLAMWHAPALVHWHGVEPVKSLFFSLVALFRNFTAYAMFCLAWFGVFLLAGIGLSLIATLLVGMGLMGAGGAGIGGALMVGSALVLAAMSLSSTWFTFRDSFSA